MGRPPFDGISVSETMDKKMPLDSLCRFLLILSKSAHQTSFTALQKDKFLVDHEGNPYKRFVPTVAPVDMVQDIESLLNKKDGTK
jgi:glutathione peroxidase-family protein